MSGFRTLDQIERSQYLHAFKAWVEARAGGKSDTLIKGMTDVSITHRTYCAATLEVLFHEMFTESKRSRVIPKVPSGFEIKESDYKAGRIEFNLPNAFRAYSEEYLFTDSIVKETCGRCGGQGRDTCSVCSGSGRLLCNDCHGGGKCPTCHGDKAEACPTCHGNPNSACPACTGKGWIRKDFETVRCPSCISGLIVCDECAGRGKIECKYCFGKGICPSCKGMGSTPCSKCGGQGNPICSACGGEGEWHIYSMLSRQVSRREVRSFDALDMLPRKVTDLVTHQLETSSPVVEESLKPNEDPSLEKLSVDLASFVGRIWNVILKQAESRPHDIYLRFSARAVPVAKIQFAYSGKTFEGYFVGPAKEFFCNADPVEYMLDIALRHAEGNLEQGDYRAAAVRVLETIEEAVANDKYRIEYGKLLAGTAVRARKAMVDASQHVAIAASLVLPAIHFAFGAAPQWKGYALAAIAAGVSSLLIAPALGRLPGINLAYTDSRKVGRLSVIIAATAASLISLPFSGEIVSLPIGISAGLVAGTAALLVFGRRPKTLSLTESNLIKLCLRYS